MSLDRGKHNLITYVRIFDVRNTARLVTLAVTETRHLFPEPPVVHVYEHVVHVYELFVHVYDHVVHVYRNILLLVAVLTLLRCRTLFVLS